MHKQHKLPILIAVAILLGLTVCGSIWDLEIARALYIGQMPADNPFGILFSYIGIIPTFVGWSFLGASILCLSGKCEDAKKRRRLTAVAILLFVLSFFYFCTNLYVSNVQVFKVPFLIAYGLGSAVLYAAARLGYRLSDKSDDGNLLNKALFLAAVSLVTLLMISCGKEIMCRPRFRFVLATQEMDCFRNWWQSGKALKAHFDTGTVTDEFASLPSGHSAYGMFAIFMFPVLGDYTPGLRQHKSRLFALGFLWWAVTAYSRMTAGAHYLTDVTIAGLVTILAYAVVSAAAGAYRRKCADF